MADVNNVEIQEQLNKLLTDQKRIMRENTRSLREQVALTNEMVESLNKANISGDIVQKSNSLKNALMGAAEEASKFSKSNQEMAEITSGALEETDDGFEGLLNTYGKATAKAGIWGAATGGFIEGISKGFNLLSTGLSGVLSLAGTVVEGMFSIGKAILSIPFKIFNAFINEANRMQGEALLAKEFEETREAFGDFGADLSKHVIKGYKNLRGELAETGLSTYRVLGFMHERLKYVREQFEALGATAHGFGLEIAQQSEYFAAYQKGLGLSGDMMKGLAQATQGTDDSFEDTLRTTTKFTTQLGKQFGISQKVIGRDVGEMAKDLKTFGSVGVRQMGQMSVFARKLGADFKDLLGVVNKFDNFEDAAESAARLAQAFGLNIDAMEMINEQDPAARVEQLRKAFFQTGKDITKLTRQERNYLAATAGIEDQALNSVFALQSQGKTYDEITSAGQTAEQQQITQAEAMEKLSDSIKRLIKNGRRTGGFFDRFMMGFKRGMRWATPFRDVMRNIKKSLWAAERAGRQVGRAFVKSFPGVKKFLQGMKEFFHPKKFERMAGKVVSAFKNFFNDLGNPQTAKKALGNLLGALKKAFFGMAGEQRGAMSKIVEGFKQGFKAVGQVILSGIKIAIEYVTKFLKAITNVIKGESSFVDAMKEMFNDGASQGSSFMGEIWDEISGQLGEVTSQLGDAFLEMMGTVWDKVKKWWSNIDWWEVIKTTLKSDPGKLLAGVLVGPAFLGVFGKGIGMALGMVKGNFLGGMGGMMSKLGPLLANPWTLAAATIAAIGVTAYQVFEEIEKDYAILNNDIRTISTLAETRKKILDEELVASGLQINDYEKMANLDRKSLKTKLDILSVEKDLTKEQLVKLKARSMNDLTEEIDATYKKMEIYEKAKINNGKGPGDQFHSVVADFGQGGLKAQAQMLMKKRAMIRAEFDKKISDTQSGFFKFFSKQKNEKMPKEDPMDFDSVRSTFEDVDKFSPIKIKKATKNLKVAKEMIIGKDGVKDQMNSIVVAFKGFNNEEFIKSANVIDSLGVIPSSLASISKSKIDHKSFKSNIVFVDDGISQLAEMYTKTGPLLEAAGPGAEKAAADLVKLSALPIGMAEIADTFGELSESTKLFASSKGVEDLPIVRSIIKMVESANYIRKELSSLDDINLRPKLNNLSKALGLHNKDSMTIEHENFNVNINLTVELDPTKLTDAIVDTGRVLRSPKQRR